MATVEIIIWVALAMVAALILLKIFGRALGKEAGQTETLISSTGDYDGDGIPDYFDKCACEVGNDNNDGCPSSVNIEDTNKLKEINQKCKDEIKKSVKK